MSTGSSTRGAQSRLRPLIVLAGTILLMSGCGTAEEDPAGDRPVDPGTPVVVEGPPQLAVSFDDLPAGREFGDGTVLASTGIVPVRVKVSALADADLDAVPGVEGGSAVRFPAVDASSKRRVVVTAVPAGDPTALDPGPQDFSFGASILLDSVSEGGLDNGNNVLQRGLFSDRSQFKIQVDGGVVSCRVAGDAGQLIVAAERPVEPGEWYRVTCTRIGQELTLDVEGADDAPARVTVTGPTGMVIPSPGAPVVVGGKARPDGTPLEGDSDPFNGLVDDVMLIIEQSR